MGMIVDPSLTINRKCGIFASLPFGTVFANQYKWFIKDVFSYLVEYASRTVIWIRSWNSITLSNRFSETI